SGSTTHISSLSVHDALPIFAQHELPLGALAAVEEDHLRAALHRDRAHVPLRRGPGSGGPEEHNLHGPVPEGPRALNVFGAGPPLDRKSTRLNSSHVAISYSV